MRHGRACHTGQMQALAWPFAMLQLCSIDCWQAAPRENLELSQSQLVCTDACVLVACMICVMRFTSPNQGLALADERHLAAVPHQAELADIDAIQPHLRTSGMRCASSA